MVEEENVFVLLCASLLLSLCGGGAALALVIFTVWGLAETSNHDVVSACDSGGAMPAPPPLSLAQLIPHFLPVWWFAIIMLLWSGCSFAGCRHASDAPNSGAAGCGLLLCASVMATALIVTQAFNADPNADCVNSEFENTKLIHTAKTWWWIALLSSALQATAGLCFCCMWAMEPKQPVACRGATVVAVLDEQP